MTIDIYCNYGVLGAEKVNVYTYHNPHARAVCWDRLTVEIPAGWEVWESQSGETLLVDPAGVSHLIHEVLCGSNVPFLRYYDPQINADRYYKLTIVG